MPERSVGRGRGGERTRATAAEVAVACLLAGSQQEGAHGGSEADADSATVRPHVAHGVKHRHARSDGPARGVDVDGHVLLLVRRVQVQQLRLGGEGRGARCATSQSGWC